MATRRWLQALTRHASAISRDSSVRFLATPLPYPNHPTTLEIPTAKAAFLSANPGPGQRSDQWSQARHFSSNRGGDDEENEDDDEDDEEDDGEISEDEEVPASSGGSRREYSPEEKEAEAAAIGYKVIGPLQESDKLFKPYEPVFAIVQVSGLSFLVDL